MKKLFCLTLILLPLLDGCTKTSPPTVTDTATTVSATPLPFEGGNCEMIAETLTLRNQTVKLPSDGRFVLESHLATKEDTFPSGRLFPQTNTEAIDAHLKRACALQGKTDCSAVYASRWVKEWTPPEGGKAGQGSVGDLKPSAQDEMYSGNMYWKEKPKPGTKYLAYANGRSVVVVVGYETGPLDPKFLGGLQGEVMNALGTTDQSKITWGKLKDQTLKPGPVKCLPKSNS